MKLIVGLGNPGRKYEQTRHNIGFTVVQTLLRQQGGASTSLQFEGETSEIRLDGEKIILLRPYTYMNASGQSVRKAFDFYKLSLEDLLVICDDLNLPCGRVRLRPGGSAGGQKGLADVARHLGSDQWARLKIGIGRPPAKWQVTDYVLGGFEPDEKETIQAAVFRAADATEAWIRNGITDAMSRYNALAD